MIPSSSFNSRISVCSGRSPVFDLAAGKLPQAGHRLAWRALRDQHAAVGIDEGAGGNKNDFRRSQPVTASNGSEVTTTGNRR